MKSSSRISVGLLLILLSVIAGCGTKLQKAGGTVKVAGSPVKEGNITFYPVAGGRPAMGSIVDGKFDLSFERPGDGLPPGDYKVVIVADIWKENKAAAKAKEIEEAMMKKSGAAEQSSNATLGELIHIVPEITTIKKRLP